MRVFKRKINRIYGFILTMLKIILAYGKRMAISEVLIDCNKVIEIDVEDNKFFNIVYQSHAKYLGIANEENRKNVLNQISNKDMKKRILNKKDYPNPTKNNADILVLSGNSHELLTNYENFFHCKYVIIERKMVTKHFFKLITALIKHTFLLRIDFNGIIKSDQSNTRFMVFKILHPMKRQKRNYISPIVGVEGFFTILNNKNINYAILRWFESLPYIELGEDIDLLVDDKDIEQIETLLNEEPGLIPSDIYSVTGLPGFDSRGMAYYPPLLATEILDNTIYYKNQYKVPNPEKHFLSLAYHAIYHKGERSGLISRDHTVIPCKRPEHDYSNILKNMAKENNYDVEISLEGLRDYLGVNSWSPPMDTLGKLAKKNKWVKDNFAIGPRNNAQVGLVVFILREKVWEVKKQDEIIRELKEEGFDILYKKEITEEKEREYISNRIRGGNWGPGPYEISGGKPAVILIAYDLIPQPPTEEQLKQHPYIDNSRVLVKRKIRDKINYSLPYDLRCNMIHSSDYYDEALEYVSIAAPEYLGEKLDNRINELVGKFNLNNKYEVLTDMTKHGHRAKVELIKYKNGKAVKKTYRPNFIRFCEREIYVMENFYGKIEGVMELLEHGDNYFIVPYYEDILNFKKHQSKLLPLNVTIKAINNLRDFYDYGYALIDFNPGNIIYDKKKGVKIIDFEFLYKYHERERPGKFEDCFDMAGIPLNFSGDSPRMQIRTYSDSWERYVGLDLESLLYDHFVVQHLKRQMYLANNFPKWCMKKTYSILSISYEKLIIFCRRLIS